MQNCGAEWAHYYGGDTFKLKFLSSISTISLLTTPDAAYYIFGSIEIIHFNNSAKLTNIFCI